MASVYSIRAKLDVTKSSSRRDRLLVDPLGEERHVVGALVEDRAEAVLEQVLGQVGVVRDVGEGDLRLDHPELGEVPAGVRVLRPEGRPERVDARQRQAVRLDVELARDGQVGRLAEEVLRSSRRRPRACAGGWPGRASRRGTARPRPRRRWPSGSACGPSRSRARRSSGGSPWRDSAGPGRPRRSVFVRARRWATSRRYSKRVPLRRDRVGLRIVHPADHDDRVGEELDGLPRALRGGDRAA